MGSLTTWNRLEPRTRSQTLPGLAARVGDPLWLLGRQEQAGELEGSDTASPVSVRLSYEVVPISRWVAGTPAPGTVGSTYPAGSPVEALVNADPEPVGLRDRAAGGRRFLRLLGATLSARYSAALRGEFALPALDDGERDGTDDLGLRWSSALAGRALDGASLRTALADPDPTALRTRVGVDDTDTDPFDSAAQTFADWWDRRHGAVSGAWRPDRLAAPFALGAVTGTGPVTLSAPTYRGGRVDWHTFDLATGSLATGDPAPTAEHLNVLPTRLSFPGMPAARWWEFENGTVDLGRLDAAPDDLGRLLLAEFSLVYGNDFFVVPVTLPAGSVCRITELQVQTSYGETILVPSTSEYDSLAGLPRWRLFHLTDGTSDADSGSGLLVLPPCAVDVLDGPVVEEVLFTRDEMANMAWSVELRVPDPVGLPVDRREVDAANERRGDGPPGTDSTLRYRLSTPVPDSWLPLVPTTNGASLEQRGSQAPAGTLLGSDTPFRLDTVELPRVGRRAGRRTHSSHGTDGTVYIWSGWSVRAGRGESNSGLRHDDLTHERER